MHSLRSERLLLRRVLVTATALSITLSSAWADDWTTCTTAVGKVDQTIQACSRIIRSGGKTRKELALAYYSRGLAYSEKGDYGRALADYRMAIKLKPDIGVRFNDRPDKGQRQGPHFI